MRHRVPFVAALLLSAGAAPAGAAPRWQAPVRADDAVAVAAGPDGTVVVATVQTVQTVQTVIVGQTVGLRRLRPDGALATNRAIETAAPLTGSPFVALDEDRRAIVAWQTAQAQAPETRVVLRPIRAARVDPGDSRPPTVLALTDPADQASLDGFVAGAQPPTLMWSFTRSARDRALRVARWGPAPAPSTFTARPGGELPFGRFAAGPGGLVLRFAATPAGPIVQRTTDGGRMFGPARRIPNGGHTGDERALAVDRRGGAVLAWDTGSAFPEPIEGPLHDDGLLMVTTVRAGTGRPRRARVLSTTPPIRDIRVVADPDGGGFVCWREGQRRLRMARVGAGSSTRRVALASGSGAARAVACLADGLGGGTALWTEPGGRLAIQDVSRAGRATPARTLASGVRPELIFAAAAGTTTAVVYDQAGRRTLRVRR